MNVTSCCDQLKLVWTGLCDITCEPEALPVFLELKQ